MDYIPVIDLARINCIKTETKDWEEAANSIREALSGIGFMYLINHGVSEDVVLLSLHHLHL
jgi:isopenicillin N synthase-like dioxygenase